MTYFVMVPCLKSSGTGCHSTSTLVLFSTVTRVNTGALEGTATCKKLSCCFWSTSRLNFSWPTSVVLNIIQVRSTNICFLCPSLVWIPSTGGKVETLSSYDTRYNNGMTWYVHAELSYAHVSHWKLHDVKIMWLLSPNCLSCKQFQGPHSCCYSTLRILSMVVSFLSQECFT